MPTQALIFDLDGTLLDTLQDLTNATNHVLASLDHPPITTSVCKQMIGNGVHVLLQRATGKDPHTLENALEDFLAFYHQHKFDNTHPFPDIPNTLNSLTTLGHRLAILSNKPHPATIEMVHRLLGNWNFEQVLGQRKNIPLKPDPIAAIDIAKHMNIPTKDFVFVGDSGEDMAAAKAANMFAVGVTWGLREESDLRDHGADAIIHNPTQLLNVLP